jgi:Holliday junction resolvase RusA-like endonuclease
MNEEVFRMSGELKAISKQRPRTGKAGHFFTPKRTRDYERAVREMAEVFVTDPPADFPVHMSIEIVHAVPKSWPVWKRWAALNKFIFPSVGDLDNKVKAISDALNGIVYIDDIQICSDDNSQVYGARELLTVKVTRAGYTLTEARRLYDDHISRGGA